MAQRGQMTTLAQRLEIGERSEAGQTDPEISEAMGRSVWTVRKWRRIYQREGRQGLASRMGRPPIGALESFPPEIKETIRQMRQAHPSWDPQTIGAEMETDSRFTGQKLPSRSRIAAFLKQEGLTRPYERHSELAQPKVEAPKPVFDIERKFSYKHIVVYSAFTTRYRHSRFSARMFYATCSGKWPKCHYVLRCRKQA